MLRTGWKTTVLTLKTENKTKGQSWHYDYERQEVEPEYQIAEQQ